MENRAHALAAGLFTVLLVAALIATAFWFKGDTTERTPYLLTTKGSVSGLSPQASVKLRGVEVGKVTDIRFDPTNPRVILVKIQVDKATPITKNTYAQLASQGVTGLAYVQLDDDGKNPESLPSSEKAPAEIELRPSFFERVSNTGQDLIVSAAEVAKRVNDLLEAKNQQQLLRTLAQIETTAAQVTTLTQQIEPGLKRLPALMSDTGIVLKHADSLIANLNDVTTQVGKHVDAVDRVAGAAQQVGGAAQQLSVAGDVVSQNLTGDTLPRVDALLDGAARSSRRFDRLIEDLSDQPSSLVFGKAPVPPGPGEPGFSAGGKQ